MSRNINMTTGSPARLLFVFAMPLMLGNVFQQCYTVIDTIIVGRGVGMLALAALGSVDWMNWLILSLAQGFTQGFSVRMSQKFGEGNIPALRRTIGVSARLTIIITLLVTVFSQLILPLFMTLLRIPEELVGTAELYVRILFAGIPCILFYNFTSCVLRAVGNSRTPLIAMIIASLTNIALDALTVFVFHWGVAGAALATVFSQALSGCICFYKIRRTPDLHFSLSDMRPERNMSGILLKLGYPIAAQNVVISIGGMVIQAVVNGYGTVFIAGFTATNKLFGILEIAALSYGYAVTTYVGQNIGAGQFLRIRQGVRSAAWISLLTSGVISTFMILLGRQITMLFISSDSPAEELAAGDVAYRYLFLMSIFLWILYLLHVYRSALQGMGDTFIPMIAGIVEFLTRIGVALFVVLSGLSENGILTAECIAWIGAWILLTCAYYSRIRKKEKPMS